MLFVLFLQYELFQMFCVSDFEMQMYVTVCYCWLLKWVSFVCTEIIMDPDDANDTMEGPGDKSVYYSAPGTPVKGVDANNSKMDESQEPSFYQDAKSPAEEPMECDEDGEIPPSTVESVTGSVDQVSEDESPQPPARVSYPLDAEPISSEADEGLEPVPQAATNVSHGYEHISSDEIEHDNIEPAKRMNSQTRVSPTSPLHSDISGPENNQPNYVPGSPSTDGELIDDVPDNPLNSSGLEPISPDSNLSGLDSPSKSNSSGEIEDDDNLDLNEAPPPPKKVVTHKRSQDPNEKQFLSGKVDVKDDGKKEDPHSLSKTSLHDDHGELDYDEEEVDEAVKDVKPDAKDKDEGEIDDKVHYIKITCISEVCVCRIIAEGLLLKISIALLIG